MIETKPQDQSIETILAQANLLRMRGTWDAAREKCMDALCQDPHSVAAHSLLGDIHADQGKLDDAIQWYCIALDLQPDSLADRKKLMRAVEDRKNELAQTPRKVGGAIDDITSKLTVMTSKRIVRSERAVKGAILIAAILMCSAIVAAPLVMAYRKQSQQPFSYGSSTVIQEPAVVLPRLPGDNATTPTPTPEATVPAQPATLPSDPFDAILLGRLRDVADLRDHGIEPVDVTSDPRTQRIMLTFVSTPVAGDTGSVRAQILRNALRLLLITAQEAQPNVVASYTIRALYAPSGAGASGAGASAGSTDAPATATSAEAPRLVFVGDISSSDVAGAGSSSTLPSDDTIDGLFTSVWWSNTVSG